MVDVLSAFVSALLQVLLDRLASRQFFELFRRKTSAAEAAAAAADTLKMQLLSVNAFIGDAEEKQIVNPYVKIWVDELREAVYDAQDLLDQVATQVLGVTLRSRSPSATVSEFLNSLTNKLNSNLDEINCRLRVLRDQKDCLGLREGTKKRSLPYSSSADLLYVPTTRMVDQSKVFGRDYDREEIIRRMFAAISQEVEPISVVAIVGMGGVGKTTLSQFLLNDPLVVPRFNKVWWVHVSEGSQVLHLTKKVYRSVNKCISEHDSLDVLQVDLNEMLGKESFLLVLDDFWDVSFFDWNLFKMAFTNAASGSVILVTTRNEDVAITMRASVTYSLCPLLDKDCWDIFTHYAFGNRSLETIDPTLMEIGERMVSKCKGLPLAAKVLGSLLHSITDAEKWNDILQSKMWDLPANKSNILPALRLSYQLLPSHLKACFAYCSVFPKGYKIDKWNLINLWMAEGLLHSSKTTSVHMVGDECLQELLSRSLLQRSIANDSCVIIHDLISDLAQYVGGEFFHFFEEGNAEKIPEKVRHLSFLQDKLDAPEKFEAFYKLSKVRTFLPFKLPNSGLSGSLTDKVLNSLIPRFMCTRVLSLSGFPITMLPNALGNLKHLRYLNLSCTKIKKLPETTGLLYNLQVLLLFNCVHLTSLPNNLGNLVGLHHLDITGTPLIKMPPDFGRLKLLRHLTTFVASKNTGSRISELGAVLQLHGSLSIVNLQNVIGALDASEANLMGKTFLDELVLNWANGIHNLHNEAMVLYSLQPHKNLKSLKIENYGGRTFPDWLGNPSFTNMVSVHLTDCINCLTLPPLGQLSSLKTLLIANMARLIRVGPEFYGNVNSPFRALEILVFENMLFWETWLRVEVEEFPSLKELHIKKCPKLTGNLPRRLSSLNKLVIYKSNVLAHSLPRVPMLRELEITECDALASLPQEMMLENSHVSKVVICSCSSLQSFPALDLPTRLESLQICGCKNLLQLPPKQVEHLHLEGSYDSLISFPLSSFKALRDLHIEDCPSLQSLWMSNEFIERLMYLKKIQLKNCPSLVSFANRGLPTPNLEVLSICNCENLSPQVGWGLHEMSSLGYFGLEGKLVDLESFPEEGLLPPCLTDLHIIGLQSLTSLNQDGLQHLVSLSRLVLERCNLLEFLPANGFPDSLSNLIIANCPLLVPLCQSKTGAYWPLIADIRNKDVV